MKLGLVCALAVATTGCEELPKNEFQGTYGGVLTVVASGSSIGVDGYAVTQPLAVSVVDPGYESRLDIEITLASSCRLHAHWTKRARDTSRGSEVAFLFGDAEVPSGQACTIGEATFITSFGNAHVDSGRVFTLDVAGTGTALRGSPTPGAFVNVAFRGEES